jgi:hypothetical protein
VKTKQRNSLPNLADFREHSDKNKLNSALATYELGFAQARPVTGQVGSQVEFENQAKNSLLNLSEVKRKHSHQI